MLIQITNKCRMGCPHCMQDSNPDGQHMTEEVFRQAALFCLQAQPIVVNISGGEPLEHPAWKEITQSILSIPTVKIATILTNGFWIEDDKQRIKMAKLIKYSGGRLKVQVYSHPKYYKRHEWTAEHENQFRSIGCIPDFTNPIFMQDLGRARKNCQEEVSKSTHVPSCINSHLAAIHSHSFPDFAYKCALAGKFCRPLIDV